MQMLTLSRPVAAATPIKPASAIRGPVVQSTPVRSPLAVAKTPRAVPPPPTTPALGSTQTTPGAAARKKNAPSNGLVVTDKIMVNGLLATVRFIGETHFSDGIWLGLELAEPSGKNNGTVGEQRYFTCKANHGLFVRPDKATRHGVSCASLV